MKRLSMTFMASILFLLLITTGCAVKSQTIVAMIDASAALQENNFQEFNRHVDVEGLLEQCVDTTFDEIKKQAGEYKDAVKLGAQIAKPLIVKETARQLEKQVKQGKVLDWAPALREIPSSRVMTGLIEVFGIPATDESNYEIVNVKETDKGEILTLKVKIKSGQPWLKLEIESHDVGDHYRIVKIRNLREVADYFLPDALTTKTKKAGSAKAKPKLPSGVGK